MTSSATTANYEHSSPTRRRVMGVLFIAFSLLIYFLFSRTLDPGVQTTFRMVPGGSDQEIPNWVFSSLPLINVLAGVSLVAGGYQLARGFRKRENLVLGLVGGMFIFAFLTWATADASLNLAGLLRSALVKAVPLTLGALSGVLCERSGVVNIAIEGMMLTGAFTGALVGSLTNIWIGLLAAVLSGGLLASILAVLAIKYKTDQIIAGTVINIFIGFARD